MARLTHKTADLLRRAAEEATELGHPIWGSEHVLLALAAAADGDRGRSGEFLDPTGITEARSQHRVQLAVSVAAEAMASPLERGCLERVHADLAAR